MWTCVSVMVAAARGQFAVQDIEAAQAVSTSVSRAFRRPTAISRLAAAGVELDDQGTVSVLPGVGITGTFSVVASDRDAFYADDTANQEILERWLSGLSAVPQSNVDVTIQPAPEPLVPITITYVITLPPGKIEISGRLSGTPPVDLLSALQEQLGARLVTSASVAMTEGSAELVGGNLLLATTDTSSAGILTAANQDSIRVAIAQLAGVWLGDVGSIAFSSADGSSLEAEPANDRRLTAGSVTAAFTIAVPGVAARGDHFQKDCSLLNIQVPAMDNVGDVENTLTTTPDQDVQLGSRDGPISDGMCTNEANRRGAAVWSHNDPDSDDDTDDNRCLFSDRLHLSEATYQAGSTVKFRAADDACGECPTAPPAAGSWPGVDSAASNSAFGGHQPLNLQCWAKEENPFGRLWLQRFLMPCGYRVLESTAAGWPGNCNNLILELTTFSQESCQTDCRDDPFCTTWMWTGNDDCYRGVGNRCWTETEEGNRFEVISAERLQHGLVNVIVDDFTDGVVAGLQQQFAENVQAGGLAGNATAQSEACRNICHSNIMCTFWQSFYRDGTGSDLGCWTENPGVDATGDGQNLGGLVQYPFTTAGFVDNEDVDTLTGGQFIQHHCPIPTLPTRPPAAPAPPAAAPAPPPLDDDSTSAANLRRRSSVSIWAAGFSLIVIHIKK